MRTAHLSGQSGDARQDERGGSAAGGVGDGTTDSRADEALVEGLRSRNPRAAAALFDRFAPDINRLVRSVLGLDSEHDDVVQQAVMNMLRSAHTIREASALHGWVVRVTTNTVRSELTRRRRRRWLRLDWSDDAEDEGPVPTYHDDHEARSALAEAYALLRRLSPDEHVAFVLRHVHGLALEEAAEACGWSLATFKRRLKAAQERVRALAADRPQLAEYLEGGKGSEP